MKKLIVGIVFFVTGSIILLITHQNTIQYLPKLERVYLSLGEYGTALKYTYGIIPMILGSIIFVTGIIFCLLSAFTSKKINKYL